jgi:cell division protein FtsL
MARFNLFLVVVLLLSSFWLVRVSYEARSSFVQLERAGAQAQELAVEHDRLKVDRRTAATPLVVEEAVRTRLRMFATSPSVTHYVTDVPASARPAIAPSVTASASTSGARP